MTLCQSGDAWSKNTSAVHQVVLDYSATFDTVDYKNVLNHLKNWLSISGPSFKWFK